MDKQRFQGPVVVIRQDAWKRGPIRKKRKYINEEENAQNVDASSFNVPGMKYILNNKNRFCHRVVWGLILVSSVVICIFQITNRINHFLSYPISSITSISLNRSLNYPAFTVCPNIMTKPKRRKLMELAGESNTDACEVNTLKYVGQYLKPETYWSEYKNLDNLLNMTESGYKWVNRHKRRNQTDFNLIAEENKKLFFRGTCNVYTLPGLVDFKGDEITFTALVPGETIEQFCEDDSTPIMVYMHDENEDVRFNQRGWYGVQFGTNKGYTIGVRQFDLLNTKTKPCCTLDETNKCKRKCVKNVLESANLCRLPMFEDVKSLSLCQSDSESQIAAEKFHETVGDLDYYGQCGCLHPCQETVYSVFMDRYRQDDFGQPGSFSAYFKHNAITIISETESYGLVACLGDIGGNLGLFLGLSIPAMLEFVENLFFCWRMKTVEKHTRHVQQVLFK